MQNNLVKSKNQKNVYMIQDSLLELLEDVRNLKYRVSLASTMEGFENVLLEDKVIINEYLINIEAKAKIARFHLKKVK